MRTIGATKSNTLIVEFDREEWRKLYARHKANDFGHLKNLHIALRAYRQSTNLSLREFSNRCLISASQLSRFERTGQTSLEYAIRIIGAMT
jgi:hypothetical protein